MYRIERIPRFSFADWLESLSAWRNVNSGAALPASQCGNDCAAGRVWSIDTAPLGHSLWRLFKTINWMNASSFIETDLILNRLASMISSSRSIFLWQKRRSPTIPKTWCKVICLKRRQARENAAKWVSTAAVEHGFVVLGEGSILDVFSWTSHDRWMITIDFFVHTAFFFETHAFYILLLSIHITINCILLSSLIDLLELSVLTSKKWSPL